MPLAACHSATRLRKRSVFIVSTSQHAATCTPGQAANPLKSDKACCPKPIKPKTTRSLGAIFTPSIDQLGRIVKLAKPKAERPKNSRRLTPFFVFFSMVSVYYTIYSIPFFNIWIKDRQKKGFKRIFYKKYLRFIPNILLFP